MSKAAKKRECPAVSHAISSAECGSNRISHYACPAQCPYLPFAPTNYSQLLEIEDKLNEQSMEFVLSSAPNRAARERELEKVRFDPSAHALHAWYTWNLFFARDAEGRTCAQRMETSAVADLKNDELVLLRAKEQTRVALVEIQRIVDGERIDAVDLLDPAALTLRFHDRKLAMSTGRFSTALTWIYPLPHFWRLSGTGILVPELGQFDPREVVTEIVTHLGGPVTEQEMRLWLAQNFVRFEHALMAVSRARRMEMFTGMGAKYGKAVYELQAPFAECRDKLDDVFDVEPDDLSPEERGEGFAEARMWFAKAPESKQLTPEGARATLGRVLLGQAHWRAEAFGTERFAQFRQQFEAQMGGLVRFTGERLDDLGAAMAAKEPKFEQSLVPPRLLEAPDRIKFGSSRLPMPPPGVSPEEAEAEWRREMDRAFLDDHVPALDGRTPREAALDPALRPKLIRLLKQRVCMTDKHNLETGDNLDINWMLRELGADEINFEPPPPRPPPFLDDDEEEEDYEDDDLWDFGDEPVVDESLPPAPRLPEGPLSFEVVKARIEEAVRSYDTCAALQKELCASGLTLLDDADDLTLDELSETEFGVAALLITQAARVLIPKGHRTPPTDYALLQRRFKENLKELATTLRYPSPETMMQFITDSPQPELMKILVSEPLGVCMEGPKQTRPEVAAQPVIIALVKSAVEVLDSALRV